MPKRREYEVTAFYAWMDELNAEAVRRGLDSNKWPLPDEVAHGENCWMIEFERRLSPGGSSR
jgi:hypothetical protein